MRALTQRITDLETLFNFRKNILIFLKDDLTKFNFYAALLQNTSIQSYDSLGIITLISYSMLIRI